MVVTVIKIIVEKVIAKKTLLRQYLYNMMTWILCNELQDDETQTSEL